MTSFSKSPPGGGDAGYLGRILDERYRLDAVIGAGAIGKVYAGTQLAVDRKVAIKLLHPAIRDRELGKERFLREAKAVARLSHSSCLTLFDFGSDDDLGCFYMVTEFVEGTTLASEMQQGQLPVERCYHVLYNAATALQHAHERGILHRDLKPENIMLVGESGIFSSVKVLDFGLARIREEAAQARPDPGLSDISESNEEGAEPEEAADEADAGRFGESRLTNFGELNGTPAYMSPEQCRGDLDLTPACDYYSLGVLAYELIEGRLPYESSVVQRLLTMHLSDPIPEMVSGRASQAVEDMVYRLLAKDSTQRLQSPDEILDTLRPYITVDPSRELSRATLERFKRDAPPKGQAHMMPVAESGAETLDNYSAMDTPIPKARADAGGDTPSGGLSRGSAFGTMLAPENNAETGEETSDKRSSKERVRLIASVAILVLLAAGGAWWFSYTPGNETVAVEQDRIDSQEEVAEDPPEERSLAGTVEPREETAGSNDRRDDDSKEEAPSDDATPKAPAEAVESAKTKEPRPKPPTRTTTDDTKERQRPRKLELTY